MIHSNKKKVNHFRTFEGRKKIVGLMFVSPFIIGTALFFVFPIFRSVQISFFKIENVTKFILKWSDFEFYRRLLSDKDYIEFFYKSITENLINLPLINIFALIIAVMLNKKIPLRGMFRAFFFLPVMLGTGFVMQQLLGQRVDEAAMNVARGILLPDVVVKSLGPQIANVIQDVFGRITVMMWHSGVQIIVFLAGLQSIQTSMYEASKVDGATEWQKFWLITLPMITPTIVLNLVYTVVDNCVGSSNTMMEYIKQISINSVGEGRYEYASAMSLTYTLAVLIILGIILAASRRFVDRVKE